MKFALILLSSVMLSALQVSALLSNLSLSKYKALTYDENLKCTEFNETVDPKIILHVPCVFIRLMERLKQCDFQSIQDSFSDLNGHMTAKLRKGASKVRSKTSRFKNKMLKQSGYVLKDNVQNNSNKLLGFLVRSPANMSSEEVDCPLFAKAMRIYLEGRQTELALRRLFDENKDLSVMIDELKCDQTLSSDESSYFYLKYLTKSILDILKTSGDKKMTEADVAMLFMPFVEMPTRFERTIPSQSFLLNILQNHKKLFASDVCEVNKKSDKKSAKLNILKKN